MLAGVEHLQVRTGHRLRVHRLRLSRPGRVLEPALQNLRPRDGGVISLTELKYKSRPIQTLMVTIPICIQYFATILAELRKKTEYVMPPCLHLPQ